jgi:hypothetical protein
MSNTTVACLVPVKNEAWILERFLRSAEQWADVIVLGDNGSTAESVAIPPPPGWLTLKCAASAWA